MKRCSLPDRVLVVRRFVWSCYMRVPRRRRIQTPHPCVFGPLLDGSIVSLSPHLGEQTRPVEELEAELTFGAEVASTILLSLQSLRVDGCHSCFQV